MIRRPMKFPTDSIDYNYLPRLTYPLLGSPKLDGIRALTDGNSVLSSGLKPIGNKYIQKCLKGADYEGFDGELVVGSPFITDPEDDVFHRTSGPVRRASGEPDFKFYVFDDWRFTKDTYQKRWINQITNYPDMAEIPYVVIIEQQLLCCPDDVILYTAKKVEEGYEGSILRAHWAPYKEGRTTLREEFGFKDKPTEDDEAIIVGVFEQMENANEQTTNELGLSTRSGHKENKIPKGILGGFICKSKLWEETFNIGTIKGGTLAWRKKAWDIIKLDPTHFNGQMIRYKYQRIGSIDKPRQPIMAGFCDPSFTTGY